MMLSGDPLAELVAAHIVSAIVVLGGRTVFAALTRLGPSPWPWMPRRWGWTIVGILLLAGVLQGTTSVEFVGAGV